MSRDKFDLAYTEAHSRPSYEVPKSKAGISSAKSKALQDRLEENGKVAASDHGRFYLENATATEF